MNKSQLQEKLECFTRENETVNVEMYLQYIEIDGKLNTYLPALEEGKLTLALSKIVVEQLKNVFFNKSENYEYELVSANTAEANDIRQVFHISKSKIPKADQVFGEVVNNNAPSLQKNYELGNIWSYIFKVDCYGSTIYLFRKNYSVSVLKKDSNYSLFFDNRKLSLLNKDILRLSRHFDVMLIENELIIVNRSEFEKAFDYLGAMQSTAEVNVDVIKGSKLIEGLEKISELSLNKKTLRKLLNINPESKILTKKASQIKSIAKKYKIDFKLSDDGKRITIDTKKSAIAFVEMLNDDFLKSEFSGALYKTKGKAPIIR